MSQDIHADSHAPQNDKPEAASLTETSPALRRLDNFWYHYKWTVIVAVFFISVAIVCVVQLVTRPQYDTTLAIATPYRPSSEEYNDLEALLVRLCPDDFNDDGEKKINIMVYEFYSDSDIENAKNEYEDESDRFQINLQYNRDQYNQFNNYTMTGETSVYIVSPTLYERLLTNSRLQPLTALYPEGELPAGARDDGYGIDLAATDFYQYNPAAKVIPDDAILCLHSPLVSGKSSDEKAYENEKAFFHALADFRVKE